MFHIAFYGKGGIGKSTVSANVSFQLSEKGKRILQIGCDPKHDSTRLLLEGKSQTTVLDYLRDTPKEHRDINDVVMNGAGNIQCIEAGGPEPGVGCAGRGILTMFDFLKSNGIMDRDYDYHIYDVLGDVVCGGFAVPMRKDYADAVYIVTSGEFMSLYAANNILKGMLNFDDGTPRVGGIILNCRGLQDEYRYVENFAKSVGLPIISVIPRDHRFRESEAMGRTVSQAFPGSEPAEAMAKIAEDILSKSADSSKLYHPHPLDDAGMDLVAKGLEVTEANKLDYKRIRAPSTEPNALHTCAFCGALAMLTRIEGVHTIVHGPTCCAYEMACFVDTRNLNRTHQSSVRSVWDSVSCTNLTDSNSIYGGRKELERLIRERAEKGDKHIFVVSACVAGIIGDDIDAICASMSQECGIHIVPVKVDGIAQGDLSAGREYVLESILEMTEPCSDKDDRLINVIGDFRALDEFHSFMDDSVVDLIRSAGFEINAIYPGWTDIETLKRLPRAKYSVLSNGSKRFCELGSRLNDMIGSTLMKNPLPRGMAAIEKWLSEVESLTGRDLSDAKERYASEYRERLAPIRERTVGKKVVLVLSPASDREWFTDLLDDLGIEVVYSMEDTYRISLVGYDAAQGKKVHHRSDTSEAVEKYHPDAILTDSFSDLNLKVLGRYIGTPNPGFEGLMDYAEQLGYMFDSPLTEEWRE